MRTSVTLFVCAGSVFLCSDVQHVAEHMRCTFAEAAADSFRPDPELHHRETQSDVLQPGSDNLPGNMRAQTAACKDVHDGATVETSTEACAVGSERTGSKGQAVQAPPAPSHVGGAGAQPIDYWEDCSWLESNPLPVPTERELHVGEQGLPTWRLMLVRK